MRRLVESFRTPTRTSVRRWAWAAVAMNVVIVLTGGAVRLTGSGLGCPTWPRCTADSFVPHGALGIHGVIEFGNRLMTYVLIGVAVATWVAVWRWTRAGDRRRILATVLALGIPGQAVIGGVTVLTDLNPWVVALHLLLSMGLVAGSVVLLLLLWPASASADVGSPARWLVRGTYVCLWAVLYVGTVVTGSGPHAGDADVPRNGLDPAAWTQVHADLVCLLIGLTLGCLAVLHAVGAPRAVVRTSVWLLVVELAQGLVGLVQYLTDLPIALVATHLLGAAALVAVGTRLVVVVHSGATGDSHAAAGSSPPGAQRRKGSTAAATKSSAR